MKSSTAITYTSGPTPNTVRTPDGKVQTVPDGWVLLPPGDAALTRRVKAAGDHWIVVEKKGRKVFSKGIWSAVANIDQIRAELEAERSTEGFAKRKLAAAKRREKVQAVYVEDFHGAVVTFLAFHQNHADLAVRLANAVTLHATPVGSGTVARTKRIPVEQRAEAAVIAWMRHQTTGTFTYTKPFFVQRLVFTSIQTCDRERFHAQLSRFPKSVSVWLRCFSRSNHAECR